MGTEEEGDKVIGGDEATLFGNLTNGLFRVGKQSLSTLQHHHAGQSSRTLIDIRIHQRIELLYSHS